MGQCGRVKVLCWAMRELELSTARCVQMAFRNVCTFDLPMSMADPQALGKN